MLACFDDSGCGMNLRTLNEGPVLYVPVQGIGPWVVDDGDVGSRVRVVSIENGSEWVNPLLRKLKKTFGQMPKMFHEPPIDTFRRHVWVVPEYGEDIRWLADTIGVEHVLFGSDFPHAEGYAVPLDWIEELEKFDPDETRQVMSSNLQALLQAPQASTL